MHNMVGGLPRPQSKTPKIEKTLKHPVLAARALKTDPGAQIMS